MKIVNSNISTEVETTHLFEMKTTSSMSFKNEIIALSNDNNSQEMEMVNENSNNEEDVKTILADIQIRMIKLVLAYFINNEKEDDTCCNCLTSNNEYDTQSENAFSGEENQSIAIRSTYESIKTVEYKKEESFSFSALGQIQTEDKNISIDLNFSYSQSFYEKYTEKINFEEISFLDPLVIQYEGSSESLEFLDKEMSFKFDIDANGVEDDIPYLAQGSGFLALDINKNGLIDDGSELFGPNTNDGFSELSSYDSDNNSWIDENDDIFKDLVIWNINKEGEESLLSLYESNVGAIYLEDSEVGISINKDVKDTLAQVKSTSIFLKEDGTAGLIASLDFVS